MSAQKPSRYVVCCCKLTEHSETFQVAALCGAPHTPDGCLSAEACRGVSAAPVAAWTLVLVHEWKHLPMEFPPAHPLGLPGHFALPIAAGSSCMHPKAAGHRGAGEDSLWGGVGATRPFLPSEPEVEGERDQQDPLRKKVSQFSQHILSNKMSTLILTR